MRYRVDATGQGPPWLPDTPQGQTLWNVGLHSVCPALNQGNTMNRIQHFRVDKLPNMNSTGRYQRAVHSKTLRERVGWQIKAQNIWPIEAYPIDVEVIPYFKSKRIDTTNLFFQWKFIEDRLCDLGILVDDSPQYVRDILLRGIRKRVDNLDYLECFLVEKPNLLL